MTTAGPAVISPFHLPEFFSSIPYREQPDEYKKVNFFQFFCSINFWHLKKSVIPA